MIPHPEVPRRWPAAAFAVAALAAASLPAAPAPRPSARKVPPVLPGVYVATWGGKNGATYQTLLRADLSYEASCSPLSPDRLSSGVWRGRWWYSAGTNTLHVTESLSGQGWTSYAFHLDADWDAHGAGGSRVTFSLRRAR